MQHVVCVTVDNTEDKIHSYFSIASTVCGEEQTLCHQNLQLL